VKRIVFLLFLFASTNAAAQGFGGTTRLSLMDLRFLEETPAPVQQEEFTFTLDHERRIDFFQKESAGLAFELHPFLYGTSVKDNRERQVVFDPRSAYFDLTFSQNWFRVGYMTLKWEGTDGLNPMDIASMKDWGDPLNSQSRASAAVAYGRSGESYDFEVAFIPEQTPALLPGEKSAWLPRRATFPLRTDEFELLLPDEVNYRYAERTELDDARKNNVAARIQVRGSYGDAAVAFYDGLADTPAIVPTLDVVPIQVNPKQIFRLLNPVELRPIEYRVNTYAGFYSLPLGQWIFRVAARYDAPIGDNPDIPSWSQNAVAGLERSFDIGKNTVTFILQGAWVRVPESPSLLSVRDIFNRTVLFGMRYPVGEDWSFLLGGFRSTRDDSYFVKLDASYRLSENWKVMGALESLDGPDESLLGVYGRNDRVMLGLSAVY
jgi:hypothetical protein